MKCVSILELDAAGRRAYSGKPYCADDLVEVEGKSYAKDNLGFVMKEARDRQGNGSNPYVFMNAGGGGGAAAVAAPIVFPQAMPVGGKSRGMAVLLAWLLGGFGIHKFYPGSPGWGIVWLLFCWTFIPAIIAFFEGLNYLLMEHDNFARRYG